MRECSWSAGYCRGASFAAGAGPLIYLSEAGHLHLLRDLYGWVLIPREVYDEVVVRGHGESGIRTGKDVAVTQ
jgi:predicted nucleic acid-binding protein